MNRIAKTLLALAIPVSAAFGANADLTVTITVSIDASITLEWNSGANKQADRTWPLASVSLNTVYVSTTDDVGAGVNSTILIRDSANTAHKRNLDIKNISSVPVDVDFSIISNSAWAHKDGVGAGDEVAVDKYCIKLSKDGDVTTLGTQAVDSSGVVTPGDYEVQPVNGLTAALGGQVIADELARNGVVTLDAMFVTPTDVTANGSTIVVTFTGAVD